MNGLGIGDRLHQVCLATAALEMTGAVVTLRSGIGAEAIAAASDPTSHTWAELELGLGEGPSQDAFRLRRPVLVADVGDAGHTGFMAYGTAAMAAGLGAVFAFPLQQGAARFGVLTLFADRPRQLDRLHTQRCLALADVATSVLLTRSAGATEGELDPQIAGTLHFRSEIYQAQGMVTAALGIELPEALARMRAHAFLGGHSLLDVSADILAGRLVLADDSDTG